MIARTRKLAGIAATVAVVALAGLMLIPAFFGFQRYVIMTGSMTGTYNPGSIVYDKVVPVSDLKVGDAITYSPPAGASSAKVVTHRIFSIGHDSKGNRIFRTKGDANQSPDPWKFQLSGTTQARVAFSVPYAGRIVMALSSRHTRMILIGGPALVIALLALAGVVRDGRRASLSRQPA